MPELAILIPTLNERENVDAVVAALGRALAGISYEIVFIDDDSTDGTAARLRTIAQTDARVRVIQRIGRRGLSSAVVEGMLASSAPFLAVIDADLQHDETLLPQMLERIRTTDAEIVVATRNADGGSMGPFAKHRVVLSRLAQRLSALITRSPISDPMSGFFILRRAVLDEVVYDLTLSGFKILLDILSSARRPLRIDEIGYTFRDRKRGESKLDAVVAIEFVELLIDKLTHGLVPVTYLDFGLVGLAGVGLNAILLSLLQHQGNTFEAAQTWAGAIVSCVNYFLNNRLTFRVNRLHGMHFWIGFVTFVAVCIVGLFVNVRIAVFLASAGVPSMLAGSVGVVIGSVWNYGVTSVFVWRINRATRQRARRQTIAILGTNPN